MVGLSSPLLGYESSSGEFQYLASVFSGIILCAIVYRLTGAISSLCFKAYGKLSEEQKIEWNNRGFSTAHAVVVAFASFYLVVLSDLFKEDSEDGLIVNRNSTLSNTVLGVSIGYFLTDLAMIFWLFPALGGLEYVLHHGLSLFSIILSLLSGQGQIYILLVLFSESTTPFVNLRWYLDTAGQKSSSLYICNGVALFLGWLAVSFEHGIMHLADLSLNYNNNFNLEPPVARIFLFIYFFTHMLLHFDQLTRSCSCVNNHESVLVLEDSQRFGQNSF
ncbi:TRAM/LAG1/CLN8 domain containing protein [Parasponia andersonii]|uniref:TRAM/LAG1/CLN8 domain containing protein n=1 Tax=Parasponia andersonii TaxID=3476 RepID=A0A2P5D8A6_PARAD|nr:TRAM/LAG1/CLN8 domain containing protein [Parasponia andersonii]